MWLARVQLTDGTRVVVAHAATGAGPVVGSVAKAGHVTQTATGAASRITSAVSGRQG